MWLLGLGVIQIQMFEELLDQDRCNEYESAIACFCEYGSDLDDAQSSPS